MNKPLKIFLGVTASLLCLWLAFRGFDFAQLKEGVRNANFGWFLPGALLITFNMWLRSVRWQALLTPLKKIPLSTVFPALMMGFFMNNILPARAGEVVRSVLLSKKSDIPMSSVLGSVVIERITDLLGMSLVILLASRLLPWDKLPVTPLLMTLAAGCLAALGLVLFVRRFSGSMSQRSNLLSKIFSFLTQLTAGFRALRSPLKIGAVLAFSAIIWMNELVLALIISKAMSFPLTFLESAGLLTGVSFGVMIPAAPGFIGTYEFFGKTALEMLGKAPDASLIYVVVLHFFGLLTVALIAGTTWLWSRKTA